MLAGFIDHSNVDLHECLAQAKNQFRSLSIANWEPHIYLNEDDPISNGYLNYFRDQISNDAAFNWLSLRTWRATLRRKVEHLTIFGLLFDSTSPRHLTPSAIITCSPSVSRVRKKSGCKIMSKWKVLQESLGINSGSHAILFLSRLSAWSVGEQGCS